MRKNNLLIFYFLLALFIGNDVNAQPSASSNLVAFPIPDRSISYSVAATGVSKPMIFGMDLAWPHEFNFKRGLAFMGLDRVKLVRASFQPTLPLVNGDLQQQQITDLNFRLNLIDLTLPSTQIVLNCDHPTVDPWYVGYPDRWAQLIDVTTRRVQEHGRTVVTVSPFNEPDYGWGQYTGGASNGMLDFYNICGYLRSNSRFNSIRISGGNTLNNDAAFSWYDYLKTRLDEGNTHQLAGSFDNFAGFYQTVRANGDYGAGDELHNIAEAMVGAEYGMQAAIWWGPAELARGEMAKSIDGGVRLGYAEHRPNWTAASVYRQSNGKVQAFGGTSERQAVTTTYRYVSKDKPVYYDGYGPQYEYNLVMPGGTGYMTGQTNAERVINITWGEDIQPVINGRYKLVNRNSGKVMEIAGRSTALAANIQQNTYNGGAYQQWDVTPVDSRIGGDFSYFKIANVNSGLCPDVVNFSLDNGANIISYSFISVNQQWYLEYAEDGWFYIRSKHSNKCIDVAGLSTADGANIHQWEQLGGLNQQWRFLPIDAPIEFVAPNVPANLVATANVSSIQLTWTASSSTDVAGYNIYRSESASGPFNTIARNVTGTSFLDNSANQGIQYYYKIKAIDNSLNRSIYSNQVTATATGANALVASWQFDGNTNDNTTNLYNCATSGGTSYVAGKVGTNAMSLNGTNAFVQLPATVANRQDITIAAWVYWKGGNAWQRIFDFGNDMDQNMFLTPSSGSGTLRFGIRNGGAEQMLDAPVLPINAWSHVAVTMGTSGVTMYVNGVQVAKSTAITIRPTDFKPILNYIGRSQWPDPLLNGSIDDFRIYNYALSGNEVSRLAAGLLSEVNSIIDNEIKLKVWPSPANDVIHVEYLGNNHGKVSLISVYNTDGEMVFTQTTQESNIELNASGLSSGLYFLKITNEKDTQVRKFIVKH